MEYPKYKKIFYNTQGASHLCLKALLKESDNHIILPSYKSIGQMISLKEVTKKIVYALGKKPIFSKKIKNIKKSTVNYRNRKFNCRSKKL